MQHKEATDWLEANQIQVEDATKANPSSSHVRTRASPKQEMDTISYGMG